MSDERKIYPEGSAEFGPDNPRPGRVVFDSDDIPKKTRATLKDYLRALTESNAFPISAKIEIDPNTREKQSLDAETSLYDEAAGQVSEIKSDTNDEQFVSLSGDSAGANDLRSCSDSGKFTDIEDSAATLKTFFDKNARGQGHDLLRDIVPTEINSSPRNRDFTVPESAPVVQKRISSILISNRFSPSDESPYITGGKYNRPEGAFGSIQPELGVYHKNSPLGDLAIEDLRKIGASLVLKQTGQTGAFVDGDPDNVNFLDVLPGKFGYDTRISVGSTYAANAYKGSNKRGRPMVDVGIANDAEESWADSQNPLDGVFGTKAGKFISTQKGAWWEGEKSFGAANSWVEPFTGNPLAAVTFILQGVIIVFGLSFVIGILIDQLFKAFTDERAQGKDPGSLPMGSSTDAPAATLVSLGVPYLRFPVFTCIAYGLAAFFRMKWPKARPSDDLGNFLSLAMWFVGETINIFSFIDRINESKGFYVAIMRNVMRDNVEILNTFSDPLMILGAVGEAALLGGSVQAVLAKLISLFSGLTSFKFFMATAVVGEKVKMGEVRDFAGLGPRQIETLEDNGPTRVTKSRVSRTSNALVWRHRSAPAMMILPTSLYDAKHIANNAAAALPAVIAKVGDHEGSEKHRRRIDFSATGRIDSEKVQKFENELESEYMPFYFHDLRTNEIISFHAFITDMKDSFSVMYADTQSYGRIDPVKVYNTTTRSINVNFWLIATSQEDFDSMWLSINKLTQMIYPQWSEGRQLASSGKSFIMPFSQIPTASPMIRLRIGDFIRSNGSKFNLMKLFGLQSAADKADAKFTFGAPAGKDDKTLNKEADDFRKVYDDGNRPEKEQETFKKDGFAILKRSTSHPYVTVEKAGGGFFGPPTLPFYTWTRSEALVKITGTESRPGAPKDLGELGGEYVTKKPYQYRVKFEDKAEPANPHSKETKDFTMLVLASDMKPLADPSTAPVKNEFETMTDTDALGFFDPAKNAIMAAYESTRGRGLAGFITSLDFDYGESTYETGSITRRAPKMVKVSIAFAPVHDIAPGMDSRGGMRAPLYPVGDISAHLAGDDLANVEQYGFKDTKTQDDFKKANAALGKRQDD